MAEFSKRHWDCEGPLGVPMKDKQAQAIEAVLKTLPEEDKVLKRFVTAKGPADIMQGERSDVSWISTESIDRDKEIVRAKGMNSSQFQLNPLVTMQHNYWAPPVGRSLWQRKVKDGDTVGIKAKTVYPAKPNEWPADSPWGPDTAFMLVAAQLLNGKSIGFVTLAKHQPSSHEIAQKPELAECRVIIDEWLLVEYACTYLPCNQDAIVEQVSKSGDAQIAKLLGIELPDPNDMADVTTKSAEVIPYTSWDEVEKIIKSRIEGIDWQKLAAKSTLNAVEVAAGRV